MGQVNMYLGGEPIRAHVLLQPQTRLPSSQNWLPAPFPLPAAAQNSPMPFCPKNPPPSPSYFSFPTALRLPPSLATRFPLFHPAPSHPFLASLPFSFISVFPF